MYTTSSNRDQVGVGDIKDLPGEVTSEHNKPFTFLYLGDSIFELRPKIVEPVEHTQF